MANKVGDVIEVALWYNEDQEGEADKAQEGIYKALVVTEDDYNIRLGTVMFESLEPGNDRVPEPSTFFAGTPKMMVGFAEVKKISVIAEGAGFAEDLDYEDLELLRAATQRAHRHHNPEGEPLTSEQLDVIINEIGPDTATRTI